MNISRAFRQLGWGFIIAIIDFRIGFFDLLPDAIGYIMIASALHTLSSFQPVFNKPKWVAIAMVFLSVPGMFMHSNVVLSDFSTVPLKLHLYAQALLAFHALLVFWIFDGLGVVAKQESQTVLLDTVKTRRFLFLTIYIIQLVLYPFLLNVHDSWTMLLVVFGILLFITELLFIRLPFRFSRITSQVNR